MPKRIKRQDVIQAEDGTLVDKTGRVVSFSAKRFIEDICEGNHCFICGESPLSKDFNDEHILPDWLLRKYNLHNKKIILPNGADYAYSQYRIPCCVDCNDLLGRTFEAPISKLFSQGSDAIYQHIRIQGPWLLSTWMSLIFLKTHLKDSLLRFHLDERKGQERISELYQWQELHHIHCLIRAFCSHSMAIDAEAHGSFIALPAMETGSESFDFIDIYGGQSILIRVQDIAFIQVNNDVICSPKWGPLKTRDFRYHADRKEVSNEEVTIYRRSDSPITQAA